MKDGIRAVELCMPKNWVQMLHAGMKLLWYQLDTSQKLKGLIYFAAVLSILYDSNPCSLCAGDVCRLEVFRHRSLRGTARIRWVDGVNRHRIIN